MKKGILTFVALTIIVTSCKKELSKQPIQANKTEEGTNSNASLARVVQNKDMKDYIEYNGNPEMTKLNTALYLYMSGMRKVFLQNTTCVDNLHNKIKTPDKGVLLDEFINGSGNCKTIFNNQVYIDAPEKGTFDDHSIKLIEDMSYKGIGYRPAVTLFNSEKAVLTNEFYMALLVETGEENNVVQDLIPAWHVKRNGTIQLELLDAWTSKNLTTPIYVFGYEPKADYSYNDGTILAVVKDGTDQETYNPFGRFYGTGPYVAPKPQAPLGNSPEQNTVVHESVNLYAHHEQYFDSEYTICYKVLYNGGSAVWSLEEDLGKVGRNVIDCGCYYDLNDGTFISNTNTGQTFHFLTYERDGWATYKHFYGGSQRFDYKASASTDIYVWTADASTNVEFPAVQNFKDYTNGPAKHTLRRY